MARAASATIVIGTTTGAIIIATTGITTSIGECRDVR
jgi:hypothetical protein